MYLSRSRVVRSATCLACDVLNVVS